MEKLLKHCNEARLGELGRSAALDFERFLATENPDDQVLNDYSTSIGRSYLKFNSISSLRPMLLFVEVDMSTVKMQSTSKQSFIEKILVPLCLKHEIDGIVLN